MHKVAGADVGQRRRQGRGDRGVTCQVCRSRAHTSSCTLSISCLPSIQAVCPPMTKRTVPCRATRHPALAAGAVVAPVLLHVHLCSSVSYSHTSLKYLMHNDNAEQLSQYRRQPLLLLTTAENMPALQTHVQLLVAA